MRALSRDPNRARKMAPELDWRRGDLESAESMRTALSDVQVAVYLYHSIGAKAGYGEQERHVALGFRQAAEHAGVSRIVYLGGVVPADGRSRHLEARRATGKILRQGQPTTIELRASMVIGCESASFTLIRDLAVRMPIVALPPWLDHPSCPISICDVAPAIALACVLPSAHSACYELPGPSCLSHRALIEHLTQPLRTYLVKQRIPAISPILAAWAIAALSRVPSALSRELLQGLTCDLRPRGSMFWDQLRSPTLRPIRQACVDALCDEFASEKPGPETRRRIARKTVAWLERAREAWHA